MNIESEKVSYIPGNPKDWSGRKTNPEFGNQYWYQAMQCLDLNKESVSTDIALIGYSCEEGVRRNFGRIGAKEGPFVFRERFSKVALHSDKTISDVGTIICEQDYLEECQDKFAHTITKLLQQGTFPIAIGGGHDIAYGHFKGIYNAVKDRAKFIGIINFDAHFDLRPIETKPNSGTPFNQILTEMKNESVEVNYLPIGIQKQANTKELFEIAKLENVSTIENNCCTLKQIKDQLERFVMQQDVIYLTIDIDGFSSAYAPGVSAPSPLGFTPEFVIECLEYLLKSGKVISVDFAELNPKYDIDNHTANLVARLVDFVIRYK